MNIGFGIAVVVAILILVVVGVTTWYGAHLAPAATVARPDDHQGPVHGARRRRVSSGFQQQASRIQAEVAAGRMTQTQAQAQLTAINTALDPQTFTSTVLEKLIDGTIQAGLATDAGVAVTDQQIDQRITDEKTTARSSATPG